MKIPSPFLTSTFPFTFIFTLTAFASALAAQAPMTAPAPAASAPAAPLVSNLYDWASLVVTPNAKGARREVFDGPTATVEKMQCHATTLNAGEKSGEPRKHLQEEIILVKEGEVEANWDGHSKTGGPGSVIFFAAGATTFLRNAGPTPCTYIVVYYYTALSPRH